MPGDEPGGPSQAGASLASDGLTSGTRDIPASQSPSNHNPKLLHKQNVTNAPRFTSGGVLTDVLTLPARAAEALGPVTHRPVLEAGRAIPASNIGHRLLKAAGWKEGQGLGVSEQGRTAPLQPTLQPGTLGIGYGPKRHPEASAPKPLVGDVYGTTSVGAGPQAPRPQRALPADPLASEDLDTKVKRVRQVVRAEEDEAQRRAIQRYMSRALAPSESSSAGGGNPLVRRNPRISRSNPLL